MPMIAPAPAPVPVAEIPQHLNYTAVLVATVVNFLIGWFWYSSAGFMTPWLKAIKKKPNQLDKSNMGGMMLGWLASTFLTALTVAYLIHVGHAADTRAALRLVWAGWLGLTVAGAAGDYLALRRGWTLFAINMGELFVAVTVAAVVVVNWPG